MRGGGGSVRPAVNQTVIYHQRKRRHRFNTLWTRQHRDISAHRHGTSVPSPPLSNSCCLLPSIPSVSTACIHHSALSAPCAHPFSVPSSISWCSSGLLTRALLQVGTYITDVCQALNQAPRLSHLHCLKSNAGKCIDYYNCLFIIVLLANCLSTSYYSRNVHRMSRQKEKLTFFCV